MNWPDKDELRSLVELAAPIVVVQVGMMAMGVVDTMMVGRVSAAALAAVALGNLYFFVIAIFGVGVLMALDPVIAQAVGAGDRPAIARGLQRAMTLAIALAVVGGVAMAPGEPIMGALRQPDDVVPLAAGYARAAIPGVFPFLAFTVLRQTLQAMSITRPIVVAVLAANVVNVVLNWVLVFGNLGFPALGAVGTGWATSGSRWFMALGLLALAYPALRQYLMPFRRDVLRPRPILRMLRLGAPIGFQYQLEFGAFAIIALLMGYLGTVEMAGHQVAINLASLTFMVPLGISAAAAVRVGQAVGRTAASEARAAAASALVLGASFMSAMALTFLLLPGPLAGVYTDETAVLALAATLIPIAGVFQVFDGLQVVSGGILRGIGDTRSPLVFNILGFWLVGLPVSLYLGFATDAGPLGLWWGLVAGLAAVAAFLLVRVRHRLRRDLVRVRIDDDEPAAALPD